jgi:hypothetical protein
MACIVDQLVESTLDYSLMELGFASFVSEGTVSRRSKQLRQLRLPGKKRRQETAYFFRNARAFAGLAREFAQETGDTVVAVLFRDADLKRSSGRGLWQTKWDSMMEGFRVENFVFGVPMIPKPKSEAWLLCALKENQPYQHCKVIENESGNDRSPRSLKKQLRDVLGHDVTRELLAEKVRSRDVDVFLIDMPSFLAFKERLESVLMRLGNGGDSGT